MKQEREWMLAAALPVFWATVGLITMLVSATISGSGIPRDTVLADTLIVLYSAVGSIGSYGLHRELRNRRELDS